MNIRAGDFIDETGEWRARVAAEVAARYGAIVSPEAVQRLPIGATTAPPAIWDGRKLIYDTEISPFRAILNANYKRSQRKRVLLSTSPVVVQRRADVAALHGQGLTDAEMMARLSCSVASIRQARYDQGLAANAGPRRRDASQLRVERVLDMLQRGFSPEAIAAKENLTPETVKDHARKRLGLSFRKDSAGRIERLAVARRAANTKRREDMTQALRPLAVAGHTAREIGALLGVSPAFVCDLAVKAGITLKTGAERQRECVARRQATRRAKMLAMLQAGGSIHAISRALKISYQVFVIDRAALVEAGLWHQEQDQQVAA